MREDSLERDTRALLVQLLHEQLGSQVELVDTTIANRREDYVVLLATLRHPTLSVVVKLAGPQDSSLVPKRSLHRLFHPHQSLLLTLLFLPAVGLQRLWDLRSYMGRGLALLTGRAHPYSYRHTERFLLKLAQLDGDQVLTDALARWTASLWHAEDATLETSSSHFYLDGHRKPVYTQSLIPRGLIQGFSQMRKRAYLNCELTIRVSRHSPFLRIESLFCQIRRQ
jgi:hypothetical protein